MRAKLQPNGTILKEIGPADGAEYNRLAGYLWARNGGQVDLSRDVSGESRDEAGKWSKGAASLGTNHRKALAALNSQVTWHDKNPASKQAMVDALSQAPAGRLKREYDEFEEVYLEIQRDLHRTGHSGNADDAPTGDEDTQRRQADKLAKLKDFGARMDLLEAALGKGHGLDLTEEGRWKKQVGISQADVHLGRAYKSATPSALFKEEEHPRDEEGKFAENKDDVAQLLVKTDGLIDPAKEDKKKEEIVKSAESVSLSAADDDTWTWSEADKAAFCEVQLSSKSEKGRWITIGGHPDAKTGEQHVGGFRVQINGNGTIIKGGPKGLRGRNISQVKEFFDVKEDKDGRAAGDDGETEASGQPVAPETGRPDDATDDQGGPHDREPASAGPVKNVPRAIGAVNARIDRYAKLFQDNNPEVAGWFGKLKDHVNAVGVDAALTMLGDDNAGPGDIHTQYQGRSEDMSAFCEAYLNRFGITASSMNEPAEWDPEAKVISSMAASQDYQTRNKDGDVFPVDPTLKNKLEEAKSLPGLEKSEDLNVIMDRPITNLTADVLQALDQRYGEGKWIVKAYGEDAVSGYGIFFPQRSAQIRHDAQNTIWTAGAELAKYGLSLRRDKDNKIVGLAHGDTHYDFGSKEYAEKIYGDARAWGDKAAVASDNEQGAKLPGNGKDFMVQPAFAAVGVSDADRAAGRTIAPGEGRVHITTRNGKAEIVPYSTWVKGEHLPVVFDSDDTRAMAQAAVEAINRLPESERQGQIYAPDVIKAADGYKVVEANPANDTGSSGYLGDNPFIIDSYVSHLTGRLPAHVRFIKKILVRKQAKGVSMSSAFQVPVPPASRVFLSQGWNEQAHRRGQPKNPGQFSTQAHFPIGSEVHVGSKPHKVVGHNADGSVKLNHERMTFDVHPDKLPKPQGPQAAPETGPAASQPQTPLGTLYAKADAAAESTAKKSAGLLMKFGDAGRWMKERTKLAYQRLEKRYGRTQAIAIFAGGHVVGLGSPLIVLPGSVFIGMIPFAALAETYLQLRRAVQTARGVNMSGEPSQAPEQLTMEQIHALGKELVETLIVEWHKYHECGGEMMGEPADLSSASARAPVGGLVIQGHKFAGGEFIPGHVLDNASASEKRKMTQKAGTNYVALSEQALGVFVKKVVGHAASARKPSHDEVTAANAKIDELGADRYESQIRGNSKDRAASRQRLLQDFGDGQSCPCAYCGLKLDENTVTRDKIYTAREGGRYRHDNLLPACLACNQTRSDTPFRDIKWGKLI